MDLKNHRRCDRCGEFFSVAPYMHMLANGELSYTKAEIYGDWFDLCPECTTKLHAWITEGGNSYGID